MDTYYVLVAGSGTSSRANIEALIEDHIYANGQNVIFVLPFKDRMSQGQTFLAQFAKDKGKDIIVFAPHDADLSTAPNSSYVGSDNPIADALDYLKEDKVDVFLLWNDEDTDMFTAFNACYEFGFKAYDLTDGLNLIQISAPAENVDPVIPEAEKTIPEPPAFEEEDELEDEEEEAEEEELDEDILTLAYGLVEALTEAVTKKVLEKLAEDAPKRASKGSRK